MFSTNTLEFNLICASIEAFAYSKQAKAYIKALTPSKDFDEVLLNLNKSDELKLIIKNYSKLPFTHDYDICHLLSALDKKEYLNIEEFIHIKKFLNMEKAFESYFKAIENEYIDHLQWFKNFKHLKEVLALINSVFNEDETIDDDASSNLKDIRQKLNQKQRHLDKLLADVLKRYQNYLNEAVIVMRNNRYAIPIKEGFKNKVKGIIHDVSASKQTVYIEPEDIRQATQDIEYLKTLEAQEIIKILTGLSKQIKPFKQNLELDLKKFVDLDILQAKTLYALSIHGTLPKINQDGNIHLISARHPLIQPDEVVPIDIKINAAQNVLMITGPNTGGKTVALKTVGLLTLMMQSGILVPADEKSKLAVFDQVFADIGDEQSIQQSLSTFSSHLTKIKNMLDKLDAQALILLDELGSGTDPIEGVSLAIAIIDTLKTNKLNRIMLTTHYSELKLYAYEQPDILTASVAFDIETLKPLYKVNLGIAGSSHALKIADRLGLPKTILKRAEDLLNARQTNLGKDIEKLNIEQNKVALEKERLEKEAEKLALEIKTYQAKNQAFEKEKEHMLEKIKVKATKEYEALKDKARQMIDDLTKVKKLSTPESAKLKGELNQATLDKKLVQLKPLKKGDHVMVVQYGQDGVITKVDKDTYTVSVGLFELPFKREDLTKIEPPVKKKEKPQTKYTGAAPSKAPTYELDLRGVRYEEVKALMDKAIDDALLSNTPYIRVIHGFGTGAVRKAVYAYIKQSPYIKSHRFGQEGEGLNGVTVITL